MMKRLLIFSIVMVFASCHNYKKTTDYYGGTKEFNLSYGENKRHRMDLFLPAFRDNKPLVVIIHGGGWILGEPWHLRGIQNFLHKKQYPTASITYRLANKKINYKDQLADVSQAIEFLKKNAKKYHLPSAPYIMLGESAGGHLTLMYAHEHPENVSKVISMSSPTDFYSKAYTDKKFYHWYTKRTMSIAVGDRYKLGEKIPESFKEASPLFNLANKPTLMFQGTTDLLVNKSQGFALDKALAEANIPHRLVVMNGAGHLPRYRPSWRNKVVFPEILNFIERDTQNLRIEKIEY
ncbi:alpha/beta hydrolase [Ornithobacterium rhinotracheale]|uniref:alpha/beta hydrolase n=2 Tax=Ornithobacterium rhinotracheale TaxID=28251 RepID=UPI003873AD83